MSDVGSLYLSLVTESFWVYDIDYIDSLTSVF